MLQIIRNTAGSWVVKILFVLLILSFGVWGVGDMFRKAGQSNAAIKVGRTEISFAELDQEYRRQMERLRPMFGGTLTAEQAKQFKLLEQTIAGLVQRQLFDLAAADAGVNIGETLIRRRIADEPAFRNARGEFDPNVFQAVLRNSGLSEGLYIASLKHDIARDMVAGTIASGAVAPEGLTDGLFRYRGEKRTAEVVTIPNAASGDVGAPDDAAIQAYYDDHAVVFTAPEYRSFTVARLTLDDLARSIAVSDEELRALYDERIDEFRTPERRSFKMAVFDDEAKAIAMTDAAKTSSFEDAAKKAGVEIVPIEKTAQSDLPELGEAVFSLNQGELGQPIHSDLGWHVVVVTAIEPGATKPFDAVKADLLASTRHEKATDLIFETTNRIEDGLAAGTALEEVATASKMSLTTVVDSDANGKSADGKTVTGPADFQTVLKTAFTQAPGQAGSLNESGEGTSYFVVRVDRITPPTLRPLDTVRGQVIAAWQDEEREKRAAAKAENVVAEIKAKGASADLKALAAGAGGSVAVTDPFTRDARSVKGLPPMLVRQIFSLKEGEVATGVGDNAQIIARLTKVTAADPKAAGTQVEPVRSSIIRGIAGDLATEFAQALQKTYPVTISQKRIDETYNSSN